MCKYLSTGEAGVEDDAKDVDAGGNEEDGLPLLLGLLQPAVLLGDLLHRDRADHTWHTDKHVFEHCWGRMREVYCLKDNMLERKQVT